MNAAGCRVDAGAAAPLPGRSTGPERPVIGWWHRLEQRMGLDLRSLALFRAAMATLILWDLATRAPWIRAFYTQEGVLPLDAWYGRIANSYTRYYYSLHAANGELYWQIILFSLAGFAACGLLVGWRTRLMTVVSWVLMVSLQNRHPLILNAGDSLFRIMLFWSIFLPLGARWSVDSALNTEAVTEPAKRNNRIWNVPVMCFLLQLCLMYWCTAGLKFHDVWMTEHTAVARALRLDYLISPFGNAMASWPAWILAFVTVATLVVEYVVPTFVWSAWGVGPLRLITVVLMCGMHLCFALCMDIGLFSYVACAAWLAVLPPWWWDRVFARFRRNPKRTGATIWYDADCGFCQKMALFVRTLLLLPETAVCRCQDDPAMDRVLREQNTWIFQSSDGTHAIEYDGFVAALRHSPWAFWLAPVAGLKPLRVLGTGAYRLVACTRRWMGRLLGWATFAPRALAMTRWRWVRDPVLVLLMAYIVIWNGRVFHTKKAFPKGSIRWDVAKWCNDLLDPPGTDTWPLAIGFSTRLSQQWNMFAPRPPSVRGWLDMEGTLKDESVVELFDAIVWERPPTAPTHERPALVSARYPNARWRKYLHSLTSGSRQRYRPHLCKWLAREWKARYPRRPLKAVRLYYNKERVAGDGSVTPAGRKLLWRYTVK